DIALDQFSGRSKAPSNAINPPAPEKVAPKGRQEPVTRDPQHLPKAWITSKRKFDNTNGIVWSPICDIDQRACAIKLYL
ncbi:hypothetical protein EDB87DRAFT_1658896, partial [Lactarius vividus]